MTQHNPDVVRITGRLVTRMTDAQLREARAAAAKHGVPVTEYLRRRLVLPYLVKRGAA